MAFAVTAGTGHFAGYEASVYSGIGMIVVGFGWEVANRWMPGYHPFGDAIDFYAFSLGATIAGIATVLM